MCFKHEHELVIAESPAGLNIVKVGLVEGDIPELSEQDGARRNGERLERLWTEECRSSPSPSLSRVVWRFARLRLVLCITLSLISAVLQFLGPSVLVRLILEYLEDPTLELKTGIVLLVLLFFNQLLRNIAFRLSKCVGTHTGSAKPDERIFTTL